MESHKKKVAKLAKKNKTNAKTKFISAYATLTMFGVSCNLGKNIVVVFQTNKPVPVQVPRTNPMFHTLNSKFSN